MIDPDQLHRRRSAGLLLVELLNRQIQVEQQGALTLIAHHALCPEEAGVLGAMPVAVFNAVTEADTMCAPVGSVTVPETVASVWAKASVDARKATMARVNRVLFDMANKAPFSRSVESV